MSRQNKPFTEQDVTDFINAISLKQVHDSNGNPVIDANTHEPVMGEPSRESYQNATNIASRLEIIPGSNPEQTEDIINYAFRTRSPHAPSLMAANYDGRIEAANADAGALPKQILSLLKTHPTAERPNCLFTAIQNGYSESVANFLHYLKTRQTLVYCDEIMKFNRGGQNRGNPATYTHLLTLTNSANKTTLVETILQACLSTNKTEALTTHLSVSIELLAVGHPESFEKTISLLSNDQYRKVLLPSLLNALLTWMDEQKTKLTGSHPNCSGPIPQGGKQEIMTLFNNLGTWLTQNDTLATHVFDHGNREQKKAWVRIGFAYQDIHTANTQRLSHAAEEQDSETILAFFDYFQSRLQENKCSSATLTKITQSLLPQHEKTKLATLLSSSNSDNHNTLHRYCSLILTLSEHFAKTQQDKTPYRELVDLMATLLRDNISSNPNLSITLLDILYKHTNQNQKVPRIRLALAADILTAGNGKQSVGQTMFTNTNPELFKAYFKQCLSLPEKGEQKAFALLRASLVREGQPHLNELLELLSSNKDIPRHQRAACLNDKKTQACVLEKANLDCLLLFARLATELNSESFLKRCLQQAHGQELNFEQMTSFTTLAILSTDTNLTKTYLHKIMSLLLDSDASKERNLQLISALLEKLLEASKNPLDKTQRTAIHEAITTTLERKTDTPSGKFFFLYQIIIQQKQPEHLLMLAEISIRNQLSNDSYPLKLLQSTLPEEIQKTDGAEHFISQLLTLLKQLCLSKLGLNPQIKNFLFPNDIIIDALIKHGTLNDIITALEIAILIQKNPGSGFSLKGVAAKFGIKPALFYGETLLPLINGDFPSDNSQNPNFSIVNDKGVTLSAIKEHFKSQKRWNEVLELSVWKSRSDNKKTSFWECYNLHPNVITQNKKILAAVSADKAIENTLQKIEYTQQSIIATSKKTDEAKTLLDAIDDNTSGLSALMSKYTAEMDGATSVPEALKIRDEADKAWREHNSKATEAQSLLKHALTSLNAAKKAFIEAEKFAGEDPQKTFLSASNSKKEETITRLIETQESLKNIEKQFNLNQGRANNTNSQAKTNGKNSLIVNQKHTLINLKTKPHLMTILNDIEPCSKTEQAVTDLLESIDESTSATSIQEKLNKANIEKEKANTTLANVRKEVAKIDELLKGSNTLGAKHPKIELANRYLTSANNSLIRIEVSIGKITADLKTQQGIEINAKRAKALCGARNNPASNGDLKALPQYIRPDLFVEKLVGITALTCLTASAATALYYAITASGALSSNIEFCLFAAVSVLMVLFSAPCGVSAGVKICHRHSIHRKALNAHRNEHANEPKN